MLRNKGNGVIPLSNYRNGVIPLSNYRNGVIPLVIMSLLSRSGPEMIGNWSVYILGCFWGKGEHLPFPFCPSFMFYYCFSLFSLFFLACLLVWGDYALLFLCLFCVFIFDFFPYFLFIFYVDNFILL